MGLERYSPILFSASLLSFGLWLLYLAFGTTWELADQVHARVPVVVVHRLWFSAWGSSILLIGVALGVLGADVFKRRSFRRLVAAALLVGGPAIFVVPVPATLLFEHRLSSAGYTACNDGLSLSERTWVVEPDDCPGR